MQSKALSSPLNHSEDETVMIDATHLKAHQTATIMAADKGGTVA